MSQFRAANTDFQRATAHEAMIKRDAYSWLQAFDREELQEFATEISDAYCGAATSPDG